MHAHRILNIASLHSSLQNTLHKEIGISKILAQILINRGIKTAPEAERFLNSKLEYLLDPFTFNDMPKAVNLVKRAIKNKERVMIFGDYDVDGVTSIALLKTTLFKLGLEPLHYLPHRIKEGYGLNKNILNIVRKHRIKLLITADCGINNHEEIKELRRSNVEVIITDHHEPLNGWASPLASAAINPKIKNAHYKYRDLAGVGVAYKFCQALSKDNLFEDLDLVSLGTIADVVPLTGENRIIVRKGLELLSQTKRIGLRALMETSGITNKKITSAFVSFILGPRINASGRIDTAEVALSLLLSKKESEANELARIIESHNRQRQKIENKILEEAEAIINKEINFKEHKVIVIAKENWHPGVLGIVASKLTDRFYRPTIVISLTEDLCKGSARSIKNFHLFEVLSECRHLLEEFGGHSHAAGLVIARDNIEDFKRTINHLARERLLFEDLIPSINVDIELSLSDLNRKIIDELEMLEPFGTGNPEPLFYTRDLVLRSTPQVLGKNTLKFWVTDGNATYQAIGFGMADLKYSLVDAQRFDLIYTPQIDDWDEGEIILEVEDIFFR